VRLDEVGPLQTTRYADAPDGALDLAALVTVLIRATQRRATARWVMAPPKLRVSTFSGERLGVPVYGGRGASSSPRLPRSWPAGRVLRGSEQSVRRCPLFVLGRTAIRWPYRRVNDARARTYSEEIGCFRLFVEPRDQRYASVVCRGRGPRSSVSSHAHGSCRAGSRARGGRRHTRELPSDGEVGRAARSGSPPYPPTRWEPCRTTSPSWTGFPRPI
jgi:hypothetical protein